MHISWGGVARQIATIYTVACGHHPSSIQQRYKAEGSDRLQPSHPQNRIRGYRYEVLHF